MTKIRAISLSSTPLFSSGNVRGGAFHYGLCTLIELSRDSQIRYSSAKAYMTPNNWLSEYCTVGLVGPRMCGKSTSIVKYILDNRASSYVLCRNINNCSNIRRIFDKEARDRRLVPLVNNATCYNMEDFFINVDSVERVNNYLGDPPVKFIFIDDFSFLSKRLVDSISVLAERMASQTDQFHLVRIG